MKIYLDNCCYNRPYDDQTQLKIRLETEAKLSIQDKIELGELSLVWSYVLDFENEANPFEERKNDIRHWREKAVEDIVQTPRIIEIAKDLQEHGLRPKDCLHVSCAIKAQCEYFFTTDQGILNKNGKIENIRIINPVEFILEGKV